MKLLGTIVGLLSAFACLSPRTAAADTQNHIVTLKQSSSTSSTILSSLRTANSIAITHEWKHALNGFAAKLDPASLNALLNDPAVESVVPDGTVYAFASVVQTNAPWNLARLSTVRPLPSPVYNYTYDSSGGNGVDIYILDSGVRITHNEFEGRARWGATFGGYPDADGHGHGTHCAGTAAGKTYGVAKSASIVAVRVLNDQGSASVSNIISAINYIIQSASSTGRPSVVLIALGGSANNALDNAVVSMINAGIHVVVAAGGSNSPVDSISPARVPGAITVGASTISDSRSPFSNYGTAVDLYAPGVNIESAWNTADDATNILSGTSMAAALVAGLVAYIIGLEGNLPPSAMEAKLKDWSLIGVLSDIPAGSNNYLAHNLSP